MPVRFARLALYEEKTVAHHSWDTSLDPGGLLCPNCRLSIHFAFVFGSDQKIVTKRLYNLSTGLTFGAFYTIFRPRPVGMDPGTKCGRKPAQHGQNTNYNLYPKPKCH